MGKTKTNQSSATVSNTKQTQASVAKKLTDVKSKSSTTSGETTSSSSDTVSSSSSNSSSYSRGVSRASGEVDSNTQEQRTKALEDYIENSNVQDAYERIQKKLNSETGEFDSKYKQTLENLYNQIADRKKFNYNVNADALYQQYKDLYESQGKKAMEDTMAVNSALTGGYGSSFTQTAGQQAYQNYLEQLNDRIPELRNQAYQEYQSEGENLRNQFSLANSLYGNEYNEYRADVSDYQNERNFDYNRYAQNRQFWNDEYWNERNAERINETDTTGSEYSRGTSSTTGTSSSSAWSKTNSSTKSKETSNESSTSSSTTNTNSTQNSSSSSGGSGGSGGSSGNTNKKVYNNAKRTTASKEGSTLYKSIVNAMAQAATGNLSLKDTNDARRDTLMKMYDSLRKQGKMSEDDYLYFLDMFKIPVD